MSINFNGLKSGLPLKTIISFVILLLVLAVFNFAYADEQPTPLTEPPASALLVDEEVPLTTVEVADEEGWRFIEWSKLAAENMIEKYKAALQAAKEMRAAHETVPAIEVEEVSTEGK